MPRSPGSAPRRRSGYLVGSLVAGQVADRWASAERCLFACAAASGLLLWLLAGLAAPVPPSSSRWGFWLLMSPAITLGTTITLVHLPVPAPRRYGASAVGDARLGGGELAVRTLARQPGVGQPGAGVAAPGARRTGNWPTRSAWPRCCLFALAGYAPDAAAHAAAAPPRRPLAPLAAVRLLGDRNFIVFALGSLGASLTGGFFSQAAPLLLSHLGVPDPWITPAQTVSQSTEVVSLLLLPVLLAGLGTRHTMLLGLAVWSVSLGALALARSPEVAIPALGGWGVLVCCYLVAGQVYVNGRAHDDLRTSSQALLVGTNALGMLAGNVLAGWVRAEAGGSACRRCSRWPRGSPASSAWSCCWGSGRTGP